jgi:hypothetical protein
MKKAVWIAIGLVFFMITVVFIFPCQAQDTTINGCYKIKNGQLRIEADGPEYCKKSELPISWTGDITPTTEIPNLIGTWVGTLEAVMIADVRNPDETPVFTTMNNVTIIITHQQGVVFAGSTTGDNVVWDKMTGVILPGNQLTMQGINGGSRSIISVKVIDKKEMKGSFTNFEEPASVSIPGILSGYFRLQKQ